MHREPDYDHGDGPGHGGAASPVAGHNRANAPVQWQVLHGDKPSAAAASPAAADLDLVEAAFVEGFLGASDPTSFLRLARLPFRATAADGATLALLRVEIDQAADVGAITPHLGGLTFRYDPLPGSMVSRRRRLRFVYFDGRGPRQLGLAEALSLFPSE